MKKILSNFGMAMLGFVIILLFCRVECNSSDDPTTQLPEDPEKCGPKVVNSKWWMDQVQLNPESHYSHHEDGWAIYSYNPGASYSNVCTHKHITGYFKIGIYSEFMAKVKVNAEIVYGILFTYPITEWHSDEQIITWEKKADFNFGIKGSFGEGPGWYFPTLTVLVEYQGDVELTHAFFRQAITEIAIYSECYKYKEN
jgi:hypothetical protein